MTKGWDCGAAGRAKEEGIVWGTDQRSKIKTEQISPLFFSLAQRQGSSLTIQTGLCVKHEKMFPILKDIITDGDSCLTITL